MDIGDRLPQVATLWVKNSSVDWTGNSGWSTPVTLPVRWVEEEMILRGTNGEEALAKNKITHEGTIDYGDFIALGDLTGSANPEGLAGAIEVKESCIQRSVDGIVILKVVRG